MYFADTPKAVIWRFDYDIDSGVRRLIDAIEI
jgi:sugar lactone lactonase YvrE